MSQDLQRDGATDDGDGGGDVEVRYSHSRSIVNEPPGDDELCRPMLDDGDDDGLGDGDQLA